MLHPAHDAVSLEASRDRHKGGIVIGIQGIQDHPRQSFIFLKCVQKRSHIFHAGLTVHRVISGIRPQLRELRLVIVAQASEMDLHHPAQLRIFLRAGNGRQRLVCIRICFFRACALHCRRKCRLGPLRIRLLVHAVIQSVIRAQAAVLCEVTNPGQERLHRIPGTTDFEPADGRQPSDIFRKARFLNIDPLIRAERG